MKKGIFRLLFAMGIVFPLQSMTHKFYVSTTIIEWNTRTNNIEISVKIFTDDLEQAINAASKNPIRFSDKRESIRADAMIESYILKNFHLSIEDQAVTLRFVGTETEADLTYCYFEFVPFPDWNVMVVENTILMDIFPQQKNIVDIRMPGWSQSMFLTKEKPVETMFR